MGAGLTPLRVIRAANTEAAELSRIKTRPGKIAAGNDVYLIAMGRNPQEDKGALDNQLMAVNNRNVELGWLG